MKTGFSTLWSSKDQVDFLLKSIASAGFDGMEPTFITGAIPSPENYREEASWLKERCDDLGLLIPGMRGGLLFWSTIPSPLIIEREKAVEHCRRALDATVMMGGDVLLVVPGEKNPDIPFNDHWNRVIEFAGLASLEAEKFGIRIGIENTEALFPVTLSDWKKLLTDINSPHMRMYFDVGNLVWLENGDPAEWLRELSQWIIRIHFKDSIAGKCVLNVLEGEINWKSVMNAINDINYDGWILVEPAWFNFFPERMPSQLAGHLNAILGM